MTVVRSAVPAIKTQPLSGDASPHPVGLVTRTALMSKTGSWSGSSTPTVDFPVGALSRDVAFLVIGYTLPDAFTAGPFGSVTKPPTGWGEMFGSPDYGFAPTYKLWFTGFSTPVLSKTSVKIPSKYVDSGIEYDLEMGGGIYMLLIIPDIDHSEGITSEDVQEGEYITDDGPNSRTYDITKVVPALKRKIMFAIGSNITGIVPDVVTEPLSGFLDSPARFYAQYLLEDTTTHYAPTLTQANTGQGIYPDPTGTHYLSVETINFAVLDGRAPIRAAATSAPGDVRVRRV